MSIKFEIFGREYVVDFDFEIKPFIEDLEKINDLIKAPCVLSYTGLDTQFILII